MRRLSLLAGIAALLSVAPAALAADPRRGEQWGLSMVESDAAHAVSTGSGATVAVVDTGAHLAHEDLLGRLALGRDFVENDDTPQDGNGHGTHVAGIIAANKDNGVGVSSVAPGAKVMVVRALDAAGGGFLEDIARGIDYARTNGAKVINLSLGSDTPLIGILPDGQFDAAINRALDAGVVVVAAAGNNGAPACEQPASQGRLLCVGAVDRREVRSFYSSFPMSDFGQGLGISAPGGSGTPFAEEDILSTYFDPENPGSNSEYRELAGTSMAAPHVAGVAALLVARGVTGQAAVQRILATAKDVGAPGPDAVYGAGIVNAKAALGVTSGGAGGGGPGGGPGGGAGSTPSPGSSARFSAARKQRWSTVRKRGVVARCRASGSGICRVTVRAKGRRIAGGSARLAPGRTKTVRARLNARGRGMARRARRTKVSLRATLPGTSAQTRKVTLRR